jgi:hypothetical protein
MDLSDFADAFLADGTSYYLPASGHAASDLTAIVAHEDHAHPLIANLFWLSFTQLDDYADVLKAAGLRQQNPDRQELIVRHGPAVPFARYDLVVLDPEYDGGEPLTTRVRASDRDLKGAAERLWGSLEGRVSFEGGQASPTLISHVVGEVSLNENFDVLIARSPSMMPTAIAPTPAWSVEGPDDELASVGVAAFDSEERRGVTSANHAFAATTVSVLVDGQPGEIRRRDQISDSCFIEVPTMVQPSRRAATGALRGMSPREAEVATFEGVGSGPGPTETVVSGWDKGIPFHIEPWNRLRVLTPPITNQADSGAALLNKDGHVLGFAFDRTGFGEQPEFSSWIWAEFVYNAHGLH